MSDSRRLSESGPTSHETGPTLETASSLDGSSPRSEVFESVDSGDPSPRAVSTMVERLPLRSHSNLLGDADDPSPPLFDGAVERVEEVPCPRHAFLDREFRVETRCHRRNGVEAPY